MASTLASRLVALAGLLLVLSAGPVDRTPRELLGLIKNQRTFPL